MKRYMSLFLALTMMAAASNGSAEAQITEIPTSQEHQAESSPESTKITQPETATEQDADNDSVIRSIPEFYDSAHTYSMDVELINKTLISSGKDQNTVLTNGGTTLLNDVSIERCSAASTGGDSAIYYGVGSAALVTRGALVIDGSAIITDCEGGSGVFAYGDGVANVSDTAITTEKDSSGGIHTAGGGTVNARDLTVVTNGAFSAAIRSECGGGTIRVSGGSYTTNGEKSPAVFVTCDITIKNANLTANHSEAVCLEGDNNVTLSNCVLRSCMEDQPQNGTAWGVVLYQKTPEGSKSGKSTFTMNGGILTSENGGMFYTTNTKSEFTLNHVKLIPCENSEYLLRCTGNSNELGWGDAGLNGADCVFNAINQEMDGSVIWDNISDLRLELSKGSVYKGAITNDDIYTDSCCSGRCIVCIDDSSRWIVTGDSYLTALVNNGAVCDEYGNAVSVLDSDGTALSEGTSAYTIHIITNE